MEAEEEYMSVFNVAYILRLVYQQEDIDNDTADNKNMGMSHTEVELCEEMDVPTIKSGTALSTRWGGIRRTVRATGLPWRGRKSLAGLSGCPI